jgi:uncharacterized phage protein gp47/JayE
MPVTPQSFDDIIDAIETNLALEGSTLSDFSQGSRLRIFARANARVLSEIWTAITTIATDSNISVATGSALDLLVNTFNVSRKTGTPAAGYVLIKPKLPTNAIVINNLDVLFFESTNFLVNLPTTGSMTLGSPYAQVPVICSTVGSQWNLPAGTALSFARADLNENFYAVVGESYNNSNVPVGALSGGSDLETDGSLRSRFADYIQSLTRATYLAVTSALSTIQGVKINVIEQVPAVGFITVFVDDGTASTTLNPTLVNQIQNILFEWKAAGIGVRIQVQEKASVTVELRVKIDSSYVPSVVQQAVKNQIVNFMNTYTPGQTLFPSVLDAEAHKIDGVLSVTVISPAAPVEVLPYQVLRLSGVPTVNVTI